ncbi:MAG: tyrosine--tRNA ligase [Candidatus Levybacteria bacterium]|nr:tyrosine--tRNA ligase [Candidatus Levybacteria bacterium]
MDAIEELLRRGVDKIYPSKEELEKTLRSGKKLKIYQGFDPTSTELHIGHMVGLKKLRQWQDLGHEVIFLIGDFTGMIGDPTGKDKSRILLTREQVLENAKTYQTQTSKILRFDGNNPIVIKYNSEWLNKLSAADLLKLTAYLSVQQTIERDMFQKRLENEKDISLSEFLYPLLQGYDSVAMDVDLEIGGSDQLFNMMTGRDLMHKIKNKEKFVMTTPLLTDASGKKIGKTEGNVIGLTDKPESLFGKLMTLPDNVIIKGLEYLTDIPMEEIGNIKRAIDNGENPMTYKKKLAFEITKELNSQQEALKAQENFERTVQQKETPEEIPTINLPESLVSGATIIDALAGLELAESKSDAKRLVEQGGVTIDNKLIDNPQATFAPENGTIIKVGKRKFVKVQIPAS